MIQTNALYKSIIAAGGYTVQYRFTVNGDDYYEADIIDGTIDETLFERFSIGNLYTKTLDCTFLPSATVPRKATIEVAFRVANGTQTSDWYPKGTYYVSTRTLMEDGSLKIKAYDGSLKAKVVFAPEGSTWQETTVFALYEEICDKLGIDENEDTADYLEDNDLSITVAPDIGQSGTTMKEILSYIGTLYGKNWIVNEYNELAMIFPYQQTQELELADLFVSPAVTVDRVRIWQNESSYIQYPAVAQNVWDTMTGFILEGESPYVNADNIEDVATMLIGTDYVGFDGSDIVEDPSVQLGDGIELDGNEVMLVHRLTVIGEEFAQYSAPYEEETENEYPEVSPTARTIAKSEYRTQAYIATTAEGITENVTRVINEEASERIAADRNFTEEAQALADRLNALDDPENGTIAAIQTDVVNNGAGLSVITSWKNDVVDPYLQTQQSYMNWNGEAATLSIGRTGDPVHTEMRSNAFAVVKNNADVFTADENGAHANAFIANSHVIIGNYRWVDEGTNGYSLI